MTDFSSDINALSGNDTSGDGPRSTEDDISAESTVADEVAVTDPSQESADSGYMSNPGAGDSQAENADENVEAVAEEAAEEAPPKEKSPYDRPGRWYVVHTYAGYEQKVRGNLENRIASMNMESSIFECVIPMEDVVEFKNGKRVTVSKKVFPGYLMVRMHLDDDSWSVVRNTPAVTGFVGTGAKPTPLSRREVENILQVKDEGPAAVTESKARTRPSLAYDIGETVRVKEGPFADFSGEVSEINEDQLKVKVLVNIFGRETPVELEFSQVAKL